MATKQQAQAENAALAKAEANAAKTNSTTKTTKTTTKPASTGWTAIPAPPKVPNFWQGHGFTLMYASPGWAVYPGTFSSKTEKPDTAPLFHARKAADAKAWVEEHATAKPKPAAKPKAAAKAAPAKAAPSKPAPAKAEPKPADAEGDSQ